MIRCIARGRILWTLLLKFDLRVLGMGNTREYTFPVGIEEKKRADRAIATCYTNVGLIVQEGGGILKAYFVGI